MPPDLSIDVRKRLVVLEGPRYKDAHGLRHLSRFRKLLSRRERARRTLRWSLLHCGEDHRHLLPAGLCGAYAEAQLVRFLSHGRRGGTRGLSAMPALSTRARARPCRLPCIARRRDPVAPAGRCARCGDRRVARARDRRVEPPRATVAARPFRRDADRGRADATNAVREEAAAGDRPVDDRACVCIGVREPAPLQCDLSRALWTCAVAVATRIAGAAGRAIGRGPRYQRCADHAADGLSAAVRLEHHVRLPRAPGLGAGRGSRPHRHARDLSTQRVAAVREGSCARMAVGGRSYRSRARSRPVRSATR